MDASNEWINMMHERVVSGRLKLLKEMVLVNVLLFIVPLLFYHFSLSNMDSDYHLSTMQLLWRPYIILLGIFVRITREIRFQLIRAVTRSFYLEDISMKNCIHFFKDKEE